MKKLLLLVVVLGFFGATGLSQAKELYTLTEINYPGAAWTTVLGMSGNFILGIYANSNGGCFGFYYNIANRTYTMSDATAFGIPATCSYTFELMSFSGNKAWLNWGSPLVSANVGGVQPILLVLP